MSISHIRNRLTRNKFQSFLDKTSTIELRTTTEHLEVYLVKLLPHGWDVAVHPFNKTWTVFYNKNPVGTLNKSLPKWAQDFILTTTSQLELLSYKRASDLLHKL